MSSGIAVPEEIISAFKDVKLRKCSAVVLKVSNETLTVDKKYPAGASDPATEWKEIVNSLNENEARFIISDFQVKETELVTKGKLILVNWSPDYTPIRHKMVHASTLTNLANSIETQKTVQATEFEEIGYDVLKEAVFNHH